ncbi:MAG: carboxylesterase family protein [Gammaproteobacteria bacterium]|nr:carboxylesterase family protein [Gammaproteobacteria bacterium]
MIVETRYGKVEGTSNDGVHAFKGIPFAAPPVGEGRWRPPQPPEPWPGIRAATDWGKQAWQPAVENAGMLSFVFNIRNAAFRDEDCLQLNVFTPGADTGRRPVLVWIHGGGFQGGTGGTPVYDGSNLARRGDVVVVTINYRVGALGWLNLNELTGGRIPATGNEGLLDQVEALRWIRDNIAAFGGDPGNVTIFGESAGAMSVGALLAAPLAEGLFHRGILISGATSTANTLARSVEIADGLLRKLDVPPSDAGKLLALEPEALIEAASGYRAAGGGMSFQPCVDGAVLNEFPLDAVKNGAADGIPVLVGTQRDEWRGFTLNNPQTANLDDAGLLAEVSRNVEDPASLIEGYRRIRDGRSVATDPTSLFAAIETDRKMRMPAIDLAEALAARGESAHHYIFAHESPWEGGRLGSPHAIIIGFVFGTHAMSEESAAFFGAGRAADAVSAHLQDAFCRFARTGSPSTDAMEDWEPYDTQRRSTGIFVDPVEVESAPYDEDRALWVGREVSLPFGPSRW